MAKQHQEQGRRPPAAAPGVPATPEPPVRRWPHPIEGVEAAQPADASLHYIRCALSYQNQLLADIKALLEAVAARQAEGQDESEG